jgi:glycolate oxidase
VQFGGPAEDSPGYDMIGLAVGSEGTFGICTKIWARITRDPQAYRTLLGVFESVDDASRTISDIIAAGIVPAALEMMDELIIYAVEQAFHFGFPLDASAVLIMEVDGLEAGLDAAADRIAEIAKKNNARSVRLAADEDERLLLWKCRKKAFGAIGRLSPSYCCQDGVVPRSKIPEMLRFMQDCSKRHDIRIANVFHAGDGNMHPILLFDERDADQLHRVVEASHDILAECIRLGGSVTGEHGIGVEKIAFMDKLFSADDLETMVKVRTVFNPDGLCNPEKMLPVGGHCVEVGLPTLRRAT